MTNRIRKLFGKIVLVVLVLLLSAEVMLRVAMTFSWESPLFVSDPDIGYRMRPQSAIGNLTTNAQGFNDGEHPRHKAKGTLRLAVIGDSFVFGVVPRPQNVTSVIQRFADGAGGKIDVLNMGIPAAGPRNYLALLNRDAADMQADIVGVVLFVGNDIMQAHPDFRTSLFLGSPHEVLTKPYLMGLSAQYLCVYRTLRSSVRLVRERFRDSRDGTFSRPSFLDIEKQRAENFEMRPSGFMKQSYAAAVDTVKRMRDDAKRNRIKFFVVLAPDEIQVNQGLKQDVLTTFHLKPKAYDFCGVQQRLARDLEGAGIPVLDLLPVFQAEQKRIPLYVKQDTHWNEAGNALAANSIWSFMNERHLLAGPYIIASTEGNITVDGHEEAKIGQNVYRRK